MQKRWHSSSMKPTRWQYGAGIPNTFGVLFPSVKIPQVLPSTGSDSSAYTKPHFHAELRARLDPAAAIQGFDCHNATAWKTRVLFLILFLFFYSFSLRRRKKKSPKISSLGFHIKAWRTRGENEWKFQLALHQPSFVPLTNVYFAVSSHIAVRWRAHFQLAYGMARVANFILQGTAFESKEKQCATRSLSRSWRSECVTVAG